MKKSEIAMLLSAPYLAKTMTEEAALFMGWIYVVIFVAYLFVENRTKK